MMGGKVSETRGQKSRQRTRDRQGRGGGQVATCKLFVCLPNLPSMLTSRLVAPPASRQRSRLSVGRPRPVNADKYETGMGGKRVRGSGKFFVCPLFLSLTALLTCLSFTFTTQQIKSAMWARGRTTDRGREGESGGGDEQATGRGAGGDERATGWRGGDGRARRGKAMSHPKNPAWDGGGCAGKEGK